MRFTNEEKTSMGIAIGTSAGIVIGSWLAPVADEGHYNNSEIAAEVNYSDNISCNALTITALERNVWEAKVSHSKIGDSEEVTQVVVSWGTSDTTMRHGSEDLFEPQRHDYSQLGKGVYEITAMIFTVDEDGLMRFVDPGDNCTVSLKIN